MNIYSPDRERILQGMDYPTYYAFLESLAVSENPPDIPEGYTPERLGNCKLNFQRSSRIKRTHTPSEEMQQLIRRIDQPQLWMVITEGWCGDSAQSLPFIAMLADLNPNITLRILLRDRNADIMAHYQTNGTMSIPILAVFDAQNREVFRWGPRPAEGVELFTTLKAEGLEKEAILEKLHLWYGRNRGKAVEGELAAKMKAALPNG